MTTREELRLAESRDRTARIGGEQRGLPMDQVVRPLVGREGPSVARREILEQLDTRTRPAAKSGDAQASAEDIVEMFLFHAVIFTLADDLQAQHISVEFQACFCVVHDNGCVVDAEK